MRRPSGTWHRPREGSRSEAKPSMRAPSYQTSPDKGFMTPQMLMSVVLLPAPLAPMMLTTSPG